MIVQVFRVKVRYREHTRRRENSDFFVKGEFRRPGMVNDPHRQDGVEGSTCKWYIACIGDHVREPIISISGHMLNSIRTAV